MLNIQALGKISYLNNQGWKVKKIPGNEKFKIIEMRAADENFAFVTRKRSKAINESTLNLLNMSNEESDFGSEAKEKHEKQMVMELYN